MVDSYDDESDYESDKCDNVNNKKNWIHKGLDHVEAFIEEDNYDKNPITDDEMSDLIGGYKSYDYSTEGEDEVTVIDYEKKEILRKRIILMSAQWIA